MIPCKRCLLAETDEAGLARSVRELVERIPEERKTPPTAYAARLAACKACESLISGMCLHCGCYVELRAAQSAFHCPAPRPEW